MKSLFGIFFIFFLIFSIHAQTYETTRLGFENLSSPQNALGVSPDGRFIITCYKDQTIRVFDISANKFVKVLKSPYVDVFDIQVTDNNKFLICNDNEGKIMDWKSGEVLNSFSFSNEIVRMVYSSGTQLIGVAQDNSTVTIIDMKLNEIKRVIKSEIIGFVSGVSFNPIRNHVAISLTANTLSFRKEGIEIYDLESGKLIKQHLDKHFTFFVDYDKEGKNIILTGLSDGGSRFFAKVDAETLLGQYFFWKGGLMKDGFYINAYPYNNKLLMVTHSNSFTVTEGLGPGPSNIIFSTLNDSGYWGKEETKRSGLTTRSVNQIHPLGNGRFLVNWFFNNVSQIFNEKTNKIESYLFTDSNGDFAVVARDGRIDGTAGALGKLFWTSRKSSKRTPIESSFEKNFSPQLLKRLISSESDTLIAFEIDDVIARLPELEIKSINGQSVNEKTSIESAQKNTVISIRVKSNLSELTDIELFHNGKMSKSIPSNGSDIYEFPAVLNQAYGNANYFYVVARSKSGTDSEKLKFMINYSVADSPPKMYLIAVGLDVYKNPKYKLNYAVADASGVEQNFKKYSSSLFGEINVRLITNENATKQEIVGAFREVQNKALEQDVLIFYFAGHGVVSKGDSKEQFYIVPYDVTQLYGSMEQLEEKAISSTLLKDFAKSVNAQKQLFILDACQSAGALEEFSSRGVSEERALAQLARSTGTFWLAATGSEQFATEFEKLGHGLFTYSLINGINGQGDTNKDGKLTVRELSTFIENMVPVLSEELKLTPQYPSSFSYGNDFPIVVYK